MKREEKRKVWPEAVGSTRVLGLDMERRAHHTPRTGKTRSRREDEKARIVRERGYVDKRLNCEHVAEFDYRPMKCRKTCRMVVVRKNISRQKGELALIPDVEHHFYVTTRRDIGAAEPTPAATRRTRWRS